MKKRRAANAANAQILKRAQEIEEQYIRDAMKDITANAWTLDT